MNYPEEMCKPMREDLTSVGFVEMKTSEEVESMLNKKEGTVLVMVNSVCGCAAGNARPAVKLCKTFSPRPDVFATVFAGQDIGATAKAREYIDKIQGYLNPRIYEVLELRESSAETETGEGYGGGLEEGLIAYWPFDGDLKDKEGDSHGTLIGTNSTAS